MKFLYLTFYLVLGTTAMPIPAFGGIAAGTQVVSNSCLNTIT